MAGTSSNGSEALKSCTQLAYAFPVCHHSALSWGSDTAQTPCTLQLQLQCPQPMPCPQDHTRTYEREQQIEKGATVPGECGGGEHIRTTPWPSLTDTALLVRPLKLPRSVNITQHLEARQKGMERIMTFTTFTFFYLFNKAVLSFLCSDRRAS